MQYRAQAQTVRVKRSVKEHLVMVDQASSTLALSVKILLRRGVYAVVARSARSALACHSRAAAPVS